MSLKIPCTLLGKGSTALVATVAFAMVSHPNCPQGINEMGKNKKKIKKGNPSFETIIFLDFEDGFKRGDRL